MKSERIEWIDFYKAIAISLVIIGHTTGKYNAYIYQFHMAAFFFISGYCLNWNGKNIIKVVYMKFCTLLLPLITIFIIGAIGFACLNVSNMYSFFYTEELPYIGFFNIFKQFFTNGSNYVWWMGATWFISVLFFVICLHAMIKYVIRNTGKFENLLYFITSVVIYIIGYYLANSRNLMIHNFDLVLIGQIYFAIGSLFRNMKKEYKRANSYIVYIFILLITVFFMGMFSRISNITMDFPSRSFNYILINIITSLNGILFIYSLSKLFELVLHSLKWPKKVIIKTGQNTCSIMFFHFIFFKVCYFILSCFHIVDISYMTNVTPSMYNIGDKYLLLFFVVSIGGSILLWDILLNIPLGKILLGQKKEVYNLIYVKIENSSMNVISKLKNYFIKLKNQIILTVNIKKRDTSLKKEKFNIILYFCFSFIALMPIIFQGIILNDELKIFMVRKQGILEPIKYQIENELSMGRPLRVLAAINYGITFLSNNIYVNRLFQVFLLMGGIFVCAYLIFVLFENKNISILFSTLAILFMPISFEHAVPNAFIGLIVLPCIYFCISMILWCYFLKKNRLKYLFFSMLFWILALLSYEFLVCYTPLYAFIYLLKRNKKSIKDFFKCIIFPGMLGLLYLVLTFVLKKFSANVYQGAEIGFVSIKSSADIINMLIKSSIPGYFLTNLKYIYLTYVYSGESYDNLFSIIYNKNFALLFNKDSLKEIYSFLYQYIFTFRNIILGISSTIILLKCFEHQKYSQQKLKLKNKIYICLTVMVFIILPILPNSISALYQGNVTQNFFTSLPVSFFVFLTIICLIALLFYFIVENSRIGYILKKLFIVFFVALMLMIQSMNSIISREQNRNYTRIENIEKLFETKYISKLDNMIVYSEDIFLTKNLLGINDGYWDEYAKIYGLNISFVKEKEKASCELYYIDSKYFLINMNESSMILSLELLDEKTINQIERENEIIFEFKEENQNDSFIFYEFKSISRE